jgi:hypothetical protein
MAVLAGLFIVWFVTSRLSRRRTGKDGRDRVIPEPRDLTPRGQLVAHSDAMRDALARQFGSAWRAKTTEELSIEPQLEQILGREHREELIRFLDQVDHLKFAPERPSHRDEVLAGELATWEPRLADVKTKITSGSPARP